MSSSKIGLAVCGVGGRMGRVLVRLIHESRDLGLVCALDRRGSPRVGMDAGELAGVGRVGLQVSDRIESLVDNRCVALDFTTPEASISIIKACSNAGLPVVIGTTGFGTRQLGQIRKMAVRTPTVLAPNTSVGVNALVGLVQQAAEVLGDAYDVEIIEAHHHFKRDAPSGTALALGQAAAKVLRRDLNRVAVSGRKGMAARKKNEIGMLSLRAGDIVGEHTVLFGGIGERVELTHRAHSRDAFGRGALRAARWLVGRPPGLYTMRNVLGLAAKG